ncbi:MAG: hypothetical protein R2788_01235 [Saprospiraceae bacterium]
MKNSKHFFEVIRILYLHNHVKETRAVLFILFMPIFLMANSVDYWEYYCSSSFEDNVESNSCLTCQITKITTANMSGCDDRGTIPDYSDDIFDVDVVVEFTDPPVGGEIMIDGPLFVEPRTEIITGTTSHTFSNVVMRTDITNIGYPVSINITASFVNPTCGNSYTKNNVQYFKGYDEDGNPIYGTKQAPRPCSVCVGPEGTINGGYPTCWPDETPPDVCHSSNSYAPIPGYPELTPERYIKVILHVFQKEDPNNPGQVHPNGPDNYSSDNIGLFQSWFSLNGSGGVNDFLSNLGDDPNDGSPEMTDARIRFILEYGEEGQDIFFHPNNDGWSISYYDCFGVDSEGSYGSKKNKYVTGAGGWSGNALAKYANKCGPNQDMDFDDWMSAEGQQNAHHVFISRGMWVDSKHFPVEPGDPPAVGDLLPDADVYSPDAEDCYNLWPGAFHIST